MSVPMIEISWLDGRITRFPEYVCNDMFGKNVQPEVDINLDDLSDGIYICVRHNEPIEAEQGRYDDDDDPRGAGCKVLADCYYQIATPEDVQRIAILRYEGEPRLVNDGGQLLNLSKFNALKSLYLGDDAGGITEQAATLYSLIKSRGGEDVGDEDIAGMLGLPGEFLQHARQLALIQGEEGHEPHMAAPCEPDSDPADEATSALVAALSTGSDDEEDYDYS